MKYPIETILLAVWLMALSLVVLNNDTTSVRRYITALNKIQELSQEVSRLTSVIDTDQKAILQIMKK